METWEALKSSNRLKIVKMKIYSIRGRDRSLSTEKLTRFEIRSKRSPLSSVPFVVSISKQPFVLKSPIIIESGIESCSAPETPSSRPSGATSHSSVKVSQRLIPPGAHEQHQPPSVGAAGVEALAPAKEAERLAPAKSISSIKTVAAKPPAKSPVGIGEVPTRTFVNLPDKDVTRAGRSRGVSSFTQEKSPLPTQRGAKLERAKNVARVELLSEVESERLALVSYLKA